MKKKYEYNIEEIKTVSLSSLASDHYTMNFVRMLDEKGNDTKQFITTHSSIPEVSSADENKMTCICNKCGNWQSIDKEEFFSKDFEFKCVRCNNEGIDLTDEESLINEIYAYMDEETFFESEIFINGEQIK